MTDYYNMGMSVAGFIVLIIAMAWTMVWTGIALWKSARNNQIVWFIVLFLVNTLGILEIVYLAFFQKNQNKAMPVVMQEVPAKKKPKKKPAKKKK